MADDLRARLAALVERERGLNHSDDPEYRQWLTHHGDRCAVNYVNLIDELAALLRELPEVAPEALGDDDRWTPVPIPLGDGRHDIGDDVRAAIVNRLIADWSLDPDLTPEKARELAMWAGAAVRSLLHELGTLRDLAAAPEEPR